MELRRRRGKRRSSGRIRRSSGRIRRRQRRKGTIRRNRGEEEKKDIIRRIS